MLSLHFYIKLYFPPKYRKNTFCFRSTSNEFASADATENLDSASKGMCIVCTTEKDNENVAEIRKKQTELLASTVDF